jgi:uncharacterized membrane protein
MYLRITRPEQRAVSLWLPLFLVWLILLPLGVLILLISIGVDLALFAVGARYHHYTLLLFRCLGVLSATRGTSVRVRNERDIVDLSLV